MGSVPKKEQTPCLFLRWSMLSRAGTSLLPVVVPLHIVAACIAVCCSISPTVAAQVSSATVMGQVRITPGNPISHPILVTLKGRGTVVGQSFTDEEGRFYFNGLPGNIYHLEINEEGFNPVSETIVSDPETAPMRMVNIYLVPKNRPKVAGEGPIAGENPYLTSEAEYGKIYPEQAVKEFKPGKKADQKGKVDDAIGHYEKAISLAPTFFMARNNLGTLYLSKSDYAAAQEQFEKVIGINPNDASAFFNLANLNLLQNKFDDALRFAEKGLSKQPSSAFGNFLKGSIYADAIAELKTFLKEFPDHQFAPKARDVLKRLESSSAAN